MQKNKIRSYIHIGMPKNLSSSLQQYFFPIHDEIYHLGVGNGNTLIDYIEDDINLLFENYLMYSKDTEYSNYKEKYIDLINKHIEQATVLNKKAVTVSLELLSFSFTPDMIDITQKASRLSELFSNSDAKILIIIRNQKDLIKSMYREFIKIGYDKSFKDFIDFIYFNKSRSFLYDFMYDKLLDVYSEYFGKDNIEILVVENYRDKTGELIVSDSSSLLVSDLCKKLNLSLFDLDLGHSNPPLSKQELFQKLFLNKKYKHDLSNGLFEGADKHRLNKYYKNEFKCFFPDLFHDVKIKRNLIEYSKELAKNDPREIDYYADPKVLIKLEEMFIKSNSELVEKYNVRLPDNYFDMKF